MDSVDSFSQDLNTLDQKLSDWVKARATRRASASDSVVRNAEEYGPIVELCDWALSAVRYIWDEHTGRNRSNRQSQAVKMCVRAGLEIVDGALEAFLDNRMTVGFALNRLIAEMGDKAVASSLRSSTSKKYLDDELSWSDAAKVLSDHAETQSSDPEPTSQYSAFRQVSSSTRWFNQPAHGGTVLATGLLDKNFGPERLRPNPVLSFDIALHAGLTVNGWSEQAIIALHNVSKDRPDSQRQKDVWVALMKLEADRGALLQISQERMGSRAPS